MFDRKFIDLIEVFQYIHINTAYMKSGNKKREGIIKKNIFKQDVNITTNSLFDTYKRKTISEIMNNQAYKRFITYYQNWYINFKLI